MFTTTAFWVTTLRSSTGRYEIFGHTCDLHIEERQRM